MIDTIKEIFQNEDALYGILFIVAFLLVIGMIGLLYFVIPIHMARKRGRSAIAAVFCCFFVSPIITYIILALMGDSQEKIERDRRYRH